MIELSYPIRDGQWSLDIRGEWDPEDRSWRRVTVYLDHLVIDEDVAAYALALELGCSRMQAENRIADDADNEWQPPYCGACNGSGEGFWERSVCRACRGSGEVRPDFDAA